jgi:hypothetical protein
MYGKKVYGLPVSSVCTLSQYPSEKSAKFFRSFFYVSRNSVVFTRLQCAC